MSVSIEALHASTLIVLYIQRNGGVKSDECKGRLSSQSYHYHGSDLYIAWRLLASLGDLATSCLNLA
jgi:hypothetical protein